MAQDSFDTIVDQICSEDSRYERGAYIFVREALDHTVKVLDKKEASSKQRHVSGVQLLEGIRHFALEQYGPLTLNVLNYWGVYCCEDFGNLVFNLVDHNVLGKTDTDKQEDFANGYDFQEAFVAPFLPPDAPEKETSRKKKDDK